MPGAQGGHLPATIWHAFMTQALAPPGKASPLPRQRREQPALPGDNRALSDIDRDYDVEELPTGAGPDAAQQPDAAPPDDNPVPVLDIPPPSPNRAARSAAAEAAPAAPPEDQGTAPARPDDASQ
jgi:hypothetical protein